MNDAFPEWDDNGGIFDYLQEYDVPWKTAFTGIVERLNFMYHGSYSGDKFISPFIRKMVSGDTVTTEEANKIAATLFSMFGANWVKEYATLSAEYNPIENYSMTEVMTDDTTVDEFGHINTRELDTAHGKTGTETVTPDLAHKKTGTETTAPLVTITEQENTYGFNTVAENGEPTSKKTQTSGGTSTLTYNTTENDTGTNETEYNTSETDTGSVTDTESGENTRTRNYELTRSGNIGVTTSQMMLQSERDLWVWNFFRDVVFPDVDYLLTIPVY